MSATVVSNNAEASRFEVTTNDEAAVLLYRVQLNTITFLHTEVPEKLRGRGIASKLAAAGLEYARKNGWTVVPLCSFVAGYIKRHPEYLELVREDHRARLTGLPMGGGGPSP